MLKSLNITNCLRGILAMKTVMNSIVLFISTALFAGTALCQVSSISSDNLVQYGKEQAYWVADVTCADESSRIIQRKTDGNEWCGKEVEGFCEATKEATAKKICGPQYTSSLALVVATQKAQDDAAQAEERAKRAERERNEQRRVANQQIEQQRLERERKAAAAAPLQKQISIDEELIEIEQDKLNLRRQELELQRRALEIQALLDQSE
jgi:flagellar biosynthesis GTPase FlhF